MFAQVTRLQYWKSEHTAQTCEDALGARVSEGVLAIADGAGTTLFSNLWARHLVDHFLSVPLLSDDPFEVEWWLRLAQERYQQRLPVMDGMPWNVLQKVQSEGSFSTLVSVCVTNVSDDMASMQILAFGDSCVFVKKAAFEHVVSFPLTQRDEFDQPPICLPSKLSAFNRYFQLPHLTHVDLAPGDVVVLATDAVSRWLISAGNGQRADMDASLDALIAQTPASWADFITNLRAHGEINDDDCTALVMVVGSPARDGELLGVTSEHAEALRLQRKQQFLRAVELQNKEQAALSFGDGVDLEREGIVFPQEQLQYARQVADALREMLQALRREVNLPQPALTLDPLWRRYAPLLLDEPCADSLRKTLVRLGVTLNPAHDRISAEVVALSPRKIAQLKNNELKVTVKSRKQMELELQIRRALRSNDDSAIISTYEQVRLSPYAREILGALHGEERIQLAIRREAARQRLKRAFESKNIEHIAIAFAVAIREEVPLLDTDIFVATLAQRFITAYQANDERALIAASDEIYRTSLQNVLRLNQREEERVALARQRLLPAVTRPIPAVARMSPDFVGHIPVMHEVWFRKACQVKKAYLFHWAFRKVSDAALEQETLDELVNAPLIKRGIDQANSAGAQPPLLPEMLLPEIFQAFKHDHMVNYAALVHAYGLSDDDVKALLQIFLGRQLFEEYLLWEKNLQLQNWLQDQHGVDGLTFRSQLEMACPWVVTLSWWRS